MVPKITRNGNCHLTPKNTNNDDDDIVIIIVPLIGELYDIWVISH